MLTSRLLQCSIGAVVAIRKTAHWSSQFVLTPSPQRSMHMPVLSSQHLVPCLLSSSRTHLSSSRARHSADLHSIPRLLTGFPVSSAQSSGRAHSSTAKRGQCSKRQLTTARAAPKPMGQQPSQSKPKGPSALEGRKMILDVIPVESFKIAGVSFEGRQDFVSNLQPDQAVMMVKKPDNTYDPNAVAVQTLLGQDLGYVPREHTARFPHDVTFGHVYSLGQNAKGLWGATVAVRPSLAPLTVEAFPANLATHINMSSNLPQEEWSAIRKATYRKADYKCEVSGGVGTEWPVECHEVWRFHEASQTLQLRGFMALHPEVHLAKHLERQQDDKRRQQAIWMLQAMNEWTVAEAEEFWKFARDTAMRRSSQEWKFDLSWLSSNNYTIPPKLQQLCRQ